MYIHVVFDIQNVMNPCMYVWVIVCVSTDLNGHQISID